MVEVRDSNSRSVTMETKNKKSEWQAVIERTREVRKEAEAHYPVYLETIENTCLFQAKQAADEGLTSVLVFGLPADFRSGRVIEDLKNILSDAGIKCRYIPTGAPSVDFGLELSWSA